MRKIIYFLIGLFVLVFMDGILWAQAINPTPKGEFLTWGYKLGIDERFRYEYKSNFDFSDSKKDKGSLLYNRVRLNARALLTDEYLNDMADVFVEGLDAQVGACELKRVTSQKDNFDLHQGYLSIYNIINSPLGVRLGRQELSYGKKRLIAAPTWNNRIRSFDAAVVHYDVNGLYTDFLYGQDVKYKINRFNHSSYKEALFGLYGGYQKNKISPLFELYFLTQNIINVYPHTRRYTVGLRSTGKLPYNIGYDIEVPYQYGKLGTKKIRAYAVHADFSKDFDRLFWKPQVILEYNEASGDKDSKDDKSNTFIPLYQTVHEPYGIMDFFRWENMREVALTLNLSPIEKLKLSPELHFFWLERTSDSWYDSTGKAIRTKLSGQRRYHVGNEASFRAIYDFNKNIKLETGYAHFFTGGYVQDTGPNDDADWCYFQLNVKY